jgi:hypothetical protein
MKVKLIIFAMPLLVLLGVSTTVAALERQREPDWQAALNQYLAQRKPTTQRLAVQRMTRASSPQRFQPEMGVAQRLDDWRWEVEVPYPPDELLCVLLAREEGHVEAQQVVYVGHHTDTLWRVGWLVHQGPASPFPPDLTVDLAALGCELGVP